MPDVMKCFIRMSILVQIVRYGVVDGVAVPQPYDIDQIHPRMISFDQSDQTQKTTRTEGVTFIRT